MARNQVGGEGVLGRANVLAIPNVAHHVGARAGEVEALKVKGDSVIAVRRQIRVDDEHSHRALRLRLGPQLHDAALARWAATVGQAVVVLGLNHAPGLDGEFLIGATIARVHLHHGSAKVVDVNALVVRHRGKLLVAVVVELLALWKMSCQTKTKIDEGEENFR